MPYVQPSWNLPHPAFNPYAYLFSHSIYCFNIILNFGYISSLISRLVELTSLRFCIFITVNGSWFRIRDKIIFCDGFWVDLRSYNGLFFIVWRLRWRVDFLIVVFLFIVFWWCYLFFSWWFWYFFGWGLLNFFNRWGRCGFFSSSSWISSSTASSFLLRLFAFLTAFSCFFPRSLGRVGFLPLGALRSSAALFFLG